MTKEDALTIAKSECDSRDWPWMQPILVSRNAASYRVWTNANARGGNAHIEIRIHDAKIVLAALTPR